MLVLMCDAARARCAIDSARAVEVLPRVRLQPLPGSVPPVAGIARHRGISLIVIDMVYALMETPCPDRWNGRIIVVQSSSHSVERFGLMVESAEPITLARGPQVAAVGQGAWGRFCQDEAGVYQLLDIDLIHERLLKRSAQAASVP